jgi:hypothetical protein
MFQARLFLFSSPATRLARSPWGRKVGAKLMMLIESAWSLPTVAGVTYPLASGVETARVTLVEKVPREPSGNDMVAMSMGERAVVGFDWVGATWAEPSPNGLRRGGRGGGGGEGEGEVTPGAPSLLLSASASRAIVDTLTSGSTRAWSAIVRESKRSSHGIVLRKQSMSMAGTPVGGVK